MGSQPLKKSRLSWLFSRAVLTALAVFSITDPACPQERETLPDSILRQIQPGSVVDNQPPRGWSHLIVKNRSRVGSGDVSMMSDQANYLTSFLFSAIVANVQADRGTGQFRLTAVGLGLGTRIEGKDTIITSKTQRQLGANLGFLPRIALSKAEERFPDTRIVGRTPTMALLDSPTRMVRDGKQRPVVIRNAILADPRTGQLETLVWLIDLDDRGAYRGAAGDFVWLPRNLVQENILDVDGREFTLGIPTENALAMTSLPRGQKQFPIPEDLKGAVGQSRWRAEDLPVMEKRFWELLKSTAR